MIMAQKYCILFRGRLGSLYACSLMRGSNTNAGRVMGLYHTRQDPASAECGFAGSFVPAGVINLPPVEDCFYVQLVASLPYAQAVAPSTSRSRGRSKEARSQLCRSQCNTSTVSRSFFRDELIVFSQTMKDR